MAALPESGSFIDDSVVAYLNCLVKGENPENLRGVAFLFDDKAPNLYFKPRSKVTDMGNLDPRVDPELGVHQLQRVDTVQSVVFTLNPTCSWVFRNGRYYSVCG